MNAQENMIVIIKALPYADQMKDLDFISEPDVIRFTWRGERFRIDSNLNVETCNTGGFLEGSNIAIILEALLKRAYCQIRQAGSLSLEVNAK